jgi:hypothetical protein
MAAVYDHMQNYREWTASDSFKRDVAEAAKLLEHEGI